MRWCRYRFMSPVGEYVAITRQAFSRRFSGKNSIFRFMRMRLEDTDQKREIKGTGLDLVNQLANFGIVPDEGYLGDKEEGAYGPYTQSKRADIYKIVIKELIKKGRAYPCFCTKEELDQLREVQEANKVIPGYYGEYARCH